MDDERLVANANLWAENQELKKEIEILNNILNRLEKAILTTYPCMDAYDRDFKTELLYILEKRKELKGSVDE